MRSPRKTPRKPVQDVLKGARADDGEAIVSALRRQLEWEFGRGSSEKSLGQMIGFARVFSEEGKSFPKDAGP